MKRAIAIGLMALAAGCAAPEKKPAVDIFAGTADPSCYTVDLFTKVQFRAPDTKVPEPWRGFAGRWGGGKWGGQWCHDLYVLDVQPSGAANVVETYAPHLPWGKRASAFRRTAQIGDDGRLRLAYGRVKVEYWIENGTLYGLRTEGGDPMAITMTRRG